MIDRLLSCCKCAVLCDLGKLIWRIVEEAHHQRSKQKNYVGLLNCFGRGPVVISDHGLRNYLMALENRASFQNASTYQLRIRIYNQKATLLYTWVVPFDSRWKLVEGTLLHSTSPLGSSRPRHLAAAPTASTASNRRLLDALNGYPGS